MFDKTIIEQSIQGDLQSFRKLVLVSSPFAYSVAFRMIGDEAQSKDIAQESMITIWKNLKKIKAPESYKSWLYRIVINKCYDELRKQKKNPEFTADEKTWAQLSDKISQNPSARLENEEMAKLISLLTEKLSPKQKAVFILSELEELSGDEISEITSMSKANIKANLHHSRKKIAELIEKYK
jgi:RNA polymerase sigma-70 factor (ECF subfamily)